jgi:hypothetical protein
LTKDLLRRLDAVMTRYEADYNRLPDIAPFVTGNMDLSETEKNERALQKAAMENNRQLLVALFRDESKAASEAFSGLSAVVYDQGGLRDAWGTPIIYMPAMNPVIGMAPQNRRFFFSAGPDGKFLTQGDNLYSYEEGKLLERK